MNQASPTEDLLQAITRLWNESFHCTLSTHSAKYPGYPFGSVLPICRDSKGYPLLMISHLAQHTRNLNADNRCAMTLIRANHADVQQWTRLTCLADAEPVDSSSAMERYCRYFPEGRRFHKELNFELYRLLPKQSYLVAGFGSARWFDVSRLFDPPRFHTAAELEILYQLNARDHALIKRLLEQRGLDAQGQAQAVGADPQGLDVRQGERLLRLQLQVPIPVEADYLPRLQAELAG